MSALAWMAALHGGPLDIPMLVISEFGGTALSFASLFVIGMLWFAVGGRAPLSWAWPSS